MTRNDALPINADGRARVFTSLEIETLCVTASPIRNAGTAAYRSVR